MFIFLECSQLLHLFCKFSIRATRNVIFFLWLLLAETVMFEEQQHLQIKCSQGSCPQWVNIKKLGQKYKRRNVCLCDGILFLNNKNRTQNQH